MKLLQSFLVVLFLSVALPSSYGNIQQRFIEWDDTDYMSDGSGGGPARGNRIGEASNESNEHEDEYELNATTESDVFDTSSNKEEDLYIDNGDTSTNYENDSNYIDDPTIFYRTPSFLMVCILISMIAALLFGVFVIYQIVRKRQGHSHSPRRQPKDTSDKNCNVKNLNDVQV